MSSSVPSTDDFIQSFSHQLTKIEGLPTYETLSIARELLKANAASVPTTRGGGEHSYLGIVVSATIYETISDTPWTIPDYPGARPIIPPAATSAQIGELVRQHTENLRQWREYQQIEAALKKQLIDSIEPIYLRAKRNRHTGFSNTSLREILNYLFSAYGQIQPNDLQQNYQKLNTAWDPNTPFELLIDQVEECMELADAGGQPFTSTQIVRRCPLQPRMHAYICSQIAVG